MHDIVMVSGKPFDFYNLFDAYHECCLLRHMYMINLAVNRLWMLGGITQTRQCNIQQYFTAVKMFIFRFFYYIFLTFAQNIDCGYTLEPPVRRF